MAKRIPQALKNAKKPEETVELCLDPALARAYDEEKLALDRSGSLSPDTSRLDELKAAIEKATLRVKMRSIPRRDFTDLMAKFPPRDGNVEDRKNGFNTDEMYPALVRESTYDPDMDDAGWALMEENLTQGEWLRLCLTALHLNQHNGSVPFS